MKKSESFAYLFIALFISFLMTFIFIKEYYNSKENSYKLALNEAKSTFKKDLDYRLWASHHGGVYVPIEEKTPPNPYLSHILERDIQTPSGKKLTLMNPAYMLRQVFEFSSSQGGSQQHITSLSPLRPENKADEWEAQALVKFSKNNETLLKELSEISEIAEIKGEKYLRYIAPLRTEKSCLKCHAIQGYKEGDIRGGISVSVPWKPYEEFLNKQSRDDLFIYSFVLLVFLLGLALDFFIRKKILKREAHTKDRLLKEQYLKDYPKDLVCWVDEHTNIVFANDFFSNVLEYTQEELKNMTLPCIYKELSLEKWKEDWEKIIKNTIFNIELEFKSKNSVLVPLDVTFGKIEYNNKFYACLVARDFREKKKQEKELIVQNERYALLNEILKKTNEKLEAALLKAEESNKFKTAFLQNISHEFRTPLNGVIGFSNLLSENKNLSLDEIKEYTAIIQLSGTRLLDMINNIIEISQISVGSYLITEKSFSLNNLIFLTESNFKNLSLQKNLDLKGFCSHPKGSDFFLSDEEKIRKVLWHLVGNALKFTEKGSISFGYNLDQEKLEFFVEDTGPGFSSANQEKIRDLFNKENNLILKSYDGSKIGLTLCKSLVSILGGNMDFKLKESGGLRIFFTFKNTSISRSSSNKELDF